MKRQFIRNGVWKVGPHVIRRKSHGPAGICFEVRGNRFGSIQDAEHECNRLIVSKAGQDRAGIAGETGITP